MRKKSEKISCCFFFEQASNKGFGKAEAAFSFGSPTLEDIMGIENQIKNECGFSEVCVINIIPLA